MEKKKVFDAWKTKVRWVFKGPSIQSKWYSGMIDYMKKIRLTFKILWESIMCYFWSITFYIWIEHTNKLHFGDDFCHWITKFYMLWVCILYLHHCFKTHLHLIQLNGPQSRMGRIVSQSTSSNLVEFKNFMAFNVEFSEFQILTWM